MSIVRMSFSVSDKHFMFRTVESLPWHKEWQQNTNTRGIQVSWAPNHNKEPWLSSRPNLKTESDPHPYSYTLTVIYSQRHKHTLTYTNTHPGINRNKQIHCNSNEHGRHTHTHSLNKKLWQNDLNKTKAADQGLYVWLWSAKQTSSTLFNTESNKVK